MIELLILFELSKKVLTMYGVSKEIRNTFSVLTTPSYGTIKPALTRFRNLWLLSKLKKQCLKGGRPSVYYSITPSGIDELKLPFNCTSRGKSYPVFDTARIKLACADVLDNRQQLALFSQLKKKAESILIDTKNLVSSKDLSYFPGMVFDNLICEYRNFISLWRDLNMPAVVSSVVQAQ